MENVSIGKYRKMMVMKIQSEEGGEEDGEVGGGKEDLIWEKRKYQNL